MHLHRYCWPELDFEMACGRGTYVRAVIRDLGVALQTGGCLTSLARLAVGPFRRQAATGLSELERVEQPADRVMPIDVVREWLAIRPPAIPARPA